MGACTPSVPGSADPHSPAPLTAALGGGDTFTAGQRSEGACIGCQPPRTLGGFSPVHAGQRTWRYLGIVAAAVAGVLFLSPADRSPAEALDLRGTCSIVTWSAGQRVEPHGPENCVSQFGGDKYVYARYGYARVDPWVSSLQELRFMFCINCLGSQGNHPAEWPSWRHDRTTVTGASGSVAIIGGAKREWNDIPTSSVSGVLFNPPATASTRTCNNGDGASHHGPFCRTGPNRSLDHQ